MLTIPEIESLIASGEGYNVEFKVSLPYVATKLPPAIFKTEGMFSIVISKKTRVETRVETREETREEIIKNMQLNPKITTSELAELIGITPKGVEYQIRNLKKEKIIKRVGANKGGSWLVIKGNKK